MMIHFRSLPIGEPPAVPALFSISIAGSVADRFITTGANAGSSFKYSTTRCTTGHFLLPGATAAFPVHFIMNLTLS